MVGGSGNSLVSVRRTEFLLISYPLMVTHPVSHANPQHQCLDCDRCVFNTIFHAIVKESLVEEVKLAKSEVSPVDLHVFYTILTSTACKLA